MQKVYKELDETLHYAWQPADKWESDLYLETKPGKYVKQMKSKMKLP